MFLEQPHLTQPQLWGNRSDQNDNKCGRWKVTLQCKPNLKGLKVINRNPPFNQHLLTTLLAAITQFLNIDRKD